MYRWYLSLPVHSSFYPFASFASYLPKSLLLSRSLGGRPSVSLCPSSRDLFATLPSGYLRAKEVLYFCGTTSRAHVNAALTSLWDAPVFSRGRGTRAHRPSSKRFFHPWRVLDFRVYRGRERFIGIPLYEMLGENLPVAACY